MKVRSISTVLVLLFCWMLPAHAQLAGSFLNVTDIRTRVLPNAVQLIITTDGTVQFGGDLSEWVDYSVWSSKPTTSFRVRLVNARAKVPAYVPVGAYPLDAAVVSPGRAPMSDPFFFWGIWHETEPRVDIELRFAVPVSVRRFYVDQWRDITFSNSLGPREVSVELGQNRRSIVITVVPDRGDGGAALRLDRSPRAEWKRELKLEKQGDAFSLRALHTPLPELLTALAEKSGRALGARPDVQDLEVSLALPSATVDEILAALQTGYGLAATPLDDTGSASGIALGRGISFATERFVLKNLTPDDARLLFPDFLLPALRADKANNALLATASPAVLDRLRSDLKLLDVPRAQVRVEATLWEFATSNDAQLAIEAARVGNGYDFGVNTTTGRASFGLDSDAAKSFRLALQASVRSGRARLRTTPMLRILNGESGTLFLGQRRFIKVLQQRGSDQILTALPLNIGISLDVAVRGANEQSITLDVTPRVSTIDETEAVSGLPTLGIRESKSTIHLTPGHTALVSGLDADLEFGRKRRIPLPVSDRNQNRTTLVVLISATLI
jgi:hypothetical protein